MPFPDILQRVQQATLLAGRKAGEVRLVAASKTVSAAALLPYLNQGLSLLGENYIQEAAQKQKELVGTGSSAAQKIEWHFIGALQSNKAKEAVGQFEMVHSVDRVSLAKELNKEAGRAGKKQSILLQVNLAAESSKAGVPPVNLKALVEQCLDMEHLKVCGLMSLPPYLPVASEMRPYHVQLRELREEILAEFPQIAPCFQELSMGMSHDFEVAIEEGSTLVRVGTAIFGARS